MTFDKPKWYILFPVMHDCSLSHTVKINSLLTVKSVTRTQGILLTDLWCLIVINIYLKYLKLLLKDCCTILLCYIVNSNLKNTFSKCIFNLNFYYTLQQLEFSIAPAKLKYNETHLHDTGKGVDPFKKTR